jgi:hypothetical protein
MAGATARWVFERVLGAVAVCGAFMALLGLGYVPFDVTDQHRAESLLHSGTPVRVSTVEGHVDHEPSKGGGWWEVDGIRVQLPDTRAGEWVELTGLGEQVTESTLSDDVEWKQGWQDVPAEVGYQAPIDVLYSVDDDGQINAMAVDDAREWAGSDEWRMSLTIGSVGLLLLLTAGAGWPFLTRD